MTKAVKISVALLIFLPAYSYIGYSGTTGNGQAQNSAPAPAGDMALNAIPLGSVTATGGGHYAPLPIITNGGTRTLVAVPKGSRVQAYVDGQPGPLVNAIPATQILPIAGFAGIGTSGSPQFSADQKRVAYIVNLDNGKQAVVVDATMSPPYQTSQGINLYFAPVGHHFAYVVRSTNLTATEYFVVDDGKAGLIYQGIASEGFSPDGNHFAYVGITPNRGLTPLEVQAGKTQLQNLCVVLDGVEQKHFAKIERPIFSQDSHHIAYLVGLDQLSVTRAVVDDQVGPAYLGVRDLVISADGSRSAYVATKLFSKKVTNGPITSDQSYRYDVAVVNGKEDPADDSGTTQIQHLSISPDGRRVAYVQLSYPPNQGSHIVIVDNAKPSLQYTSCENLKLSPDGKTLLAIVGGAQGAIFLVNGQEFGPFSGVNSPPAFSQEGGHWACCVSTGEQKFAILADGKTIPLKGIAPGTLSYQPGSGQLMLKTTTASSGMPVTFEVKGDAIAAADVPSALAYSPNHQHLAKAYTTGYGTSEVKQNIAIDDQPPTPATYTGIRNIALSDDGRHVAFIASHASEDSKANTHAFYDGTEGPGYFDIKDLALSPDGKHVAYAAEKSNGHGLDTYVVVDGMEGPAFQDALIDGAFTGQGINANDEHRQVRFEADGSLHFFPVMNGQLYRAWYAAGSFNALPSLAAHEGVKPGPRDLHNFVRPNFVSDPATAMHFVLAPDETIYGVSEADGKFKKGTLFKVKTDGSGFAVLHDFYGGDDDGEKPMSLILAPDGSLFGSLERKVFHYDPKTQQYALLTMDTKGNPGPSLFAGFAADGAIVGFGGMYGNETTGVVSFAPDGSNYVWLQNGQNGKPLLQYSQIVAGKDGTFFAISAAQGAASVVKFQSLKDTPTLVHKFVASPTDGNRPDANLVLDHKGNLYGSTSAGGMSQKGVVYKINPDGSHYQVVYNPDEFEFTKVFVPGDDGMLYGITKAGLLQLATDGSGKAPTTLVPFDGAAYTMYRGATPNIIFHEGAVYGLHNKAIYKIILPQAGGGIASAAPSVAIKLVQPQPLSGEMVVFTEPAGTASAGPATAASPPQQPPAQAQQQPLAQQQPQVQQPVAPPPPKPPAKPDPLKQANDAVKNLRGFLGQ